MLIRPRSALAVLALALSLPAAAASRHTVSLHSLLQEMTDRAAVAQIPSPAYKLLQASSHDRRKNNPFDAETWHSNTDYGQFLHTETNEGRREWVIMEHEGPGAVVRFWTPLLADKDNQTIRFYFDGSATPAISAKINELLGGRDFVKPPFAFTAWNETDVRKQMAPESKPQRGVAGDLYLPIPFAKSCKITLDSEPFYYVINYRAYEPGTRVETFSMARFGAEKAALARAAAALSEPAEVVTKGYGAADPVLGSRQELSVELNRGPNAVRELRVRIDPGEVEATLRSVVIEATFDGEQTVWCPLGEFFGTGARPNFVHDWWRTGMPSDGYLSARWVMPYRISGRISLLNLSDKPLHASIDSQVGPWKWDDRSLHFHARWHGETGIATRPRFDWNYVEVKGQGRYVGDTLTVYSPVREWYGEGDERIYVDGASYPAHIGTGTEDYYGYAWGMAGYFSSPFLSMPLRDKTDRGDWRGYTTTSRLRPLDSIPFTSGIKHDMEVWNWADTKLENAVATFWYARPGATDNRPPQPDVALVPIHADPGYFLIPGAVELDSFTAMDRSTGLQTSVQDAGLKQGEWSGGKQLFVTAKGVGDFIVVWLRVEDIQPRTLVLYGTKSFDYGILRFSVNGERAGKEFDGYSADSVASGPIEIGRFTPRDGWLAVKIEVAGTNPASRGPRYYFGLDCAVLKP
jgi:hypothetical protein